MSSGKKSNAESIVYAALEQVGQTSGRPPVEMLEQAIKSVTPALEVRSRRVGGACAVRCRFPVTRAPGALTGPFGSYKARGLRTVRGAWTWAAGTT